MSAEEEKFMAVRPDLVFTGADGSQTFESTVYAPDMGEQEIRERVADITGDNPEDIGIQSSPDEPFRYPGGRKKSSASFGTWNSSWDPKKKPPGDPSLN